MKLSIIIVNYNTSKLVYACIKSIEKYVKASHEIIVVENNSKDRIDPRIISKFLNTKFLILNTNCGFGAGNNAGAKLARGKYLLLLNPDTLVIDDSFDKMLKFLISHKKIGALTPLLYQKDRKTLQKRFFGNFQSFRGLIFRHYNYQKIDLAKEYFQTDIVTGAAMMIRRVLYNKLKGFDEKFFMYLEDDDLCKRLVDLGYKNAVFNNSKIIHYEGKSSTSLTRRRHYYKSQNYFWRKHYGLILSLMMRTIRLPYSIVQIISSALTR
jgi:GT2 family glycosyltransferase